MIYFPGMKIDSHLHLPVADNLQNLQSQKERLLRELQTCGIDAGIVIPDNIQGSEIGDLDQCIELFKDQADIYLLFPVNILKKEPEDFNVISALLQEKQVVGMKIFPGHDEHFPNDERLDEYVKLCIRFDVPLVIHTGWNIGDPDAAKWNDPRYIVDTAKKYSSLKIVICHYFWPEMEYCYEITRGFNNVFFDTSGLADNEVRKITGEMVIKDILQRTIDDNPRSVLFGTDYGMCDIGDHIRLIDSLNLIDDVRDMVFFRNAVTLYGLDC